MKTALAAVLLALAAAPALADKTITDDKATGTIDCAKDAVVTIAGNEADVALTGACKHVTISGNHNNVAIASSIAVDVTGNENKVSVVAVDALSVPGNKNIVGYKDAIKAGKTRVSNLGTDNKVARTK